MAGVQAVQRARPLSFHLPAKEYRLQHRQNPGVPQITVPHSLLHYMDMCLICSAKLYNQ